MAVKKLFWRARYALIIRRRVAMPIRFAWQCSGAGWESNEVFPCTPSEAVDEELSCWGA